MFGIMKDLFYVKLMEEQVDLIERYVSMMEYIYNLYDKAGDTGSLACLEDISEHYKTAVEEFERLYSKIH